MPRLPPGQERSREGLDSNQNRVKSPRVQNDSVEYTISEDRAAGHAAHAEAGFGLLASAGNSSAPDTAATTLQDYQMQMELMEQQNLKRLMLARQEQGLDRGMGQHPAAPPPPPTVLQKDGGELSVSGVEETNGHDIDMDDHASNAAEPALRHIVLYRVLCGREFNRCDGRVYQDEPRDALVEEDLHLAGAKPVLNVATFLASQPSPPAFVVYREFHCDSVHGAHARSDPAHAAGAQQPAREVLSVVSKELQTAMQTISLFAPDYGTYREGGYAYRHDGAPPSLLCWAPVEYSHYFMYHHREALREAAAADMGGDELKALCEYVQEHQDPMYAECDDVFDRGLVTAETLPWLFRPNEPLLLKEDGVETAHVLLYQPSMAPSDSVELFCWSWGYDGHSLRRRDKTVRLAVPACTSMPITQLAMYPMRYAAPALKQQLVERGNRFWRLRSQHYVSYEGPDFKGERVYPWDSRFMIDYQTYQKFHGHTANAFKFTSNRRAVRFDNWQREISSTVPDLSDDDAMLLPAGIHGFHFKEKKWVYLLLDNIAPVSWNKEAFDKLVLPGRIKNLVKGLVLVRKPNENGLSGSAALNPQGRRSDLIRGKGGGLIMLLHGGPGTGKTLTAESVAELAEMPLYNVTCGDVGTKPEAVEKYLDSVLHLGKRWNCVLLLDEADVFLEQRTLSDLKRNSLVSVFLRTLEYYDGILILTSNRVGTFDAAFKSRIQVALHYPPLDAASRRQVWRNFVEMLRDDGEAADYDAILAPAQIDTLAAQPMNGRQIRNAVTTARQLALFEGVALAWDHVEQAIAAASDFERHVRTPRASLSEEEWMLETVSVGTGLRG